METFWLQLVEISIMASWLIVAVIILRFLLKKAPKNYFCILWGIVAIRLICPFTIESKVGVVPTISILQEQDENEVLPETNDEDIQQNEVKEEPHVEIEHVDTSNSVLSDSQIVPVSPKPNQTEDRTDMELKLPDLSVKEVLVIVWIIGIVLFCLYSIMSVIKVCWKVSASLSVGNQIYICDEIRSPFILGILQPKIYVPSDLSAEQMKCVIAHEQTHLKRLDHYWKIIGFLLLIFYWFHPLVWVAYILFCRDMELACDECVIRKMNHEERLVYIQTLLLCSNEQRRSLAYPLAFGETGIKERVKFMVRYKKPSLLIMLMASILCITAVACFGTSQSSTNSSEEETTIEFENETDENGEHVHTVVIDEAVAPTCLKGGFTEGSHCPVCRTKIEKRKVVEALGHDFVDGVCTRCSGEMKFSLKDDGTYEFAGVGDYNAEGVLVIPSQYKGKPVTSIAQFAFWECKVKITSVEIPDSVTYIGERAFGNMLSLTSIKIPDSVTTLGNWAFYACYDLEEVILSKNLTEIGDFTFAECTSLKNIDIPSSVTCIGMNAFWGAGSYSEVLKIPSSVTTIEEGAFLATRFQYIEIPLSVTHIGKGTFRNENDAENENIIVYVEAEYKPDTWDDKWCGKDVIVIWGYKNHTLTIEKNTNSICTSEGWKVRVFCSECELEEGKKLEPSEHNFGGFTYHYKYYDKTFLVNKVNLVCKKCNTSSGDLEYTKNEDGTYKITGIGTFIGETLQIPSLYKNRQITSIEEGAFAEVEQLKTIAIDSNITHIGKNAFGDDRELTILALKHESKPETWDDEWCGQSTTVIWGYQE